MEEDTRECECSRADLCTQQEIYLFDLERAQWYSYRQHTAVWERVEAGGVPPAHGRYAGIGSRDLKQGSDTHRGVRVIESLYSGSGLSN